MIVKNDILSKITKLIKTITEGKRKETAVLKEEMG